ncbi:MAG: hypothetical protein EA383_06310 [Spirochaetaceae bacterium]|nr:MAG: hypothetical protein EA383_06310 [Spirochaetaceae bacterium]
MKRCTLFLLIAVLLFAGLGSLSAQNAEANILGIEIGQVTAWNFQADDFGTSDLLGLHFGMTDDMEVGVVFLSGDGGNMPMFSLLRMSFFLQEVFGLHVSTGNSAGNVAGGIGAFTVPVRREFDETLTTSLRISLDYLNPDFSGVSITEGILGLGISGKISF